jgi:hypothetical protein
MGIKDLPLDKGDRIYKVFEALGFKYEGLSAKNHHILTNPNNPKFFISVPDHPEVDRYTLAAEIRKAGITAKAFRAKYEQMF